ncbi:hypothetical protein GCM10017687_88050 [Streptomyces echinatus]
MPDPFARRFGWYEATAYAHVEAYQVQWPAGANTFAYFTLCRRLQTDVSFSARATTWDQVHVLVAETAPVSGHPRRQRRPQPPALLQLASELPGTFRPSMSLKFAGVTQPPKSATPIPVRLTAHPDVCNTAVGCDRRAYTGGREGLHKQAQL